MKTTRTIVVRVALGLIGIAVIGNILLYVFNKSPFNLKAINEARTISADQVSDIQVTSNSGDIQIVSYEGSDIKVQMKGKSEEKWADDFKLSVNENGSQLRIEATEVERKRWFSIDSGHFDLLIQLPHKSFDRLHIKTEAADIQVEGVQAKQSVLEAVNGDITATNLAGVINGNSGVGNISLNLDAIENDIHAAVKYGDITVTTKEAPKAIRTKLTTAMGKQTDELTANSEQQDVTNGPSVVLQSDLGDVALLLADKK